MLSTIPVSLVKNGNLIDVKSVFTSLQSVKIDVESDLGELQSELKTQIDTIDIDIIKLESQKQNLTDEESTRKNNIISKLSNKKNEINQVYEKVVNVYDKLITKIKELISYLLSLFEKILNGIEKLILSFEGLIVTLATPLTIALSQTLSNLKDFIVKTIYDPILDGFKQSFNYNKAVNEINNE